MNTLTEGFGGDRELAEASVAVMGLLNDHANKITKEKSDSLFQKINKYQINYNSQKKKNTKTPISYTGNFEDNYWNISENKFFKPKIIEKNILEIEFINKIKQDDFRNDNQIFAILDILGLNLTEDFKIDFEIGYLIQKRKYSKNVTISMFPFISMFISETNRLTIEPYYLSLRYSFTPFLINIPIILVMEDGTLRRNILKYIIQQLVETMLIKMLLIIQNT